ncbi:YckD family protein [Anaeroselena agilis]|uniref:YckD family protein n=1 Tax=Anaeroselena agilis TaxID=3063788 RepID=A0ABU3NT68_9FIRM|nr:YckD family protein [Selenomonadales bacterium 4137-cl]
MKKTIAYVTLAAMVLVVAASLVASAAPAQTPPFGQQRQAITLTDDQKKELAPLYDQLFETRKAIMQKYVDFGYMTQEQADQRIAWMKDRMSQGYGPGMMGRGFGRGHWGRGPGSGPGNGQGFGPGNGPCWQQPTPNQ